MNAQTDMTADAAVRAVPVSAALVIAEVLPNTKRPGTKAHAAFSLYVPGQTVGDYLKAGGRRVELTWDLERGLVTLASPWAPKPTEQEVSDAAADRAAEARDAAMNPGGHEEPDSQDLAEAAVETVADLPKPARKGKK